MKKFLGVMIILAVAFSCDDDDENPISGTWEIEEVTCYYGCPSQITSYPEGNGNKLVFYNNGVFERLENNAIVFRGKYSIRNSDGCDKRRSDEALYTNEGSTIPRIIAIKLDKLELSTPTCVADGGAERYKRIR
jgi:hypothetical protein